MKIKGSSSEDVACGSNRGSKLGLRKKTGNSESDESAVTGADTKLSFPAL